MGPTPARLVRAAVCCAIASGCTALSGIGDLAPVDDRGSGADASALPATDAGGQDDGAAPPGLDDARPPGGDGGAGCPAGALFCDGFESGGLASWTSIAERNGGKVSIVTAPASGGSFAMRAFASARTPDAGMSSVGAAATIGFRPVVSGSLFVRAYVHVAKPLVAETTFIKIVGENGEADMNLKVHVTGELKVDTDTRTSGAEKVSKTALPVGRWSCLEWQATIAAAGRHKLLLDGESILDDGENTTAEGGFGAVTVGLPASNPRTTQEIHVDDVVISTEPIGCR